MTLSGDLFTPSDGRNSTPQHDNTTTGTIHCNKVGLKSESQSARPIFNKDRDSIVRESMHEPKSKKPKLSEIQDQDSKIAAVPTVVGSTNMFNPRIPNNIVTPINHVNINVRNPIADVNANDCNGSATSNISNITDKAERDLIKNFVTNDLFHKLKFMTSSELDSVGGNSICSYVANNFRIAPGSWANWWPLHKYFIKGCIDFQRNYRSQEIKKVFIGKCGLSNSMHYIWFF